MPGIFWTSSLHIQVGREWCLCWNPSLNPCWIPSPLHWRTSFLWSACWKLMHLTKSLEMRGSPWERNFLFQVRNGWKLACLAAQIWSCNAGKRPTNGVTMTKYWQASNRWNRRQPRVRFPAFRPSFVLMTENVARAGIWSTSTLIAQRMELQGFSMWSFTFIQSMGSSIPNLVPHRLPPNFSSRRRPSIKSWLRMYTFTSEAIPWFVDG